MRKLAVLLTFTFLFLASANAQQQQQQPQSQGQQPFTLKVDTQLVVETVIVRDKDGKPIEGLTDKDFVVDQGKGKPAIAHLLIKHVHGASGL